MKTKLIDFFKFKQQNRERRSCSNCRTNRTTMWRKNVNGGFVCNACGLYLKKNHSHRPIEMHFRPIFKRRKRVPKLPLAMPKNLIANETNVDHNYTLPYFASNYHLDAQTIPSNLLANQQYARNLQATTSPSISNVPTNCLPINK